MYLFFQGGPGVSGAGIGNFAMFGPFDENGDTRTTTWVRGIFPNSKGPWRSMSIIYRSNAKVLDRYLSNVDPKVFAIQGILHFETETKWHPFIRWHFQVHFLNVTPLCFNSHKLDLNLFLRDQPRQWFGAKQAITWTNNCLINGRIYMSPVLNKLNPHGRWETIGNARCKASISRNDNDASVASVNFGQSLNTEIPFTLTSPYGWNNMGVYCETFGDKIATTIGYLGYRYFQHVWYTAYLHCLVHVWKIHRPIDLIAQF